MFTILIAQDEKKVKELLSSMMRQDSLYKEKRGILYKTILDRIEKPLLEHVLERTEGNQLKAAKILGINRNTMRSKIRKYGIDPDKYKC